MKILALITFASTFALAASISLAAPTNLKLKPLAAIPKPAAVLYGSTTKRLTSEGRRTVAQLASDAGSGEIAPSEIEGGFRKECSAYLADCRGNRDTNALVVVVLTEAVGNADEALEQAIQQDMAGLYQTGASAAASTQPTGLAPAPGGSGSTSSGCTDPACFPTLVNQIQDQLNSMNELSEAQSLQLQAIADRHAKLIDALSKALEKISDTGKTE